ncbi:MAG TPA: YjbE family putative metal transport protein [Magnetospirillum sp.]|jgi:YjbE family integral membrane protein|nr:YjbE family putative metal transport protein [Magnetospirillum sp.]
MLWETLSALFQVVAIDVALAGDNAVVVGMAAAGLPAGLRHRAILIGITAAAALRILFAVFTVQLLAVVGLLLAGGLLLLWVAWKLWRELKCRPEEHAAENGAAPAKNFIQAVHHIVIADVSMSLDNVLAVAGASRAHQWVLVLGLTLSVALMGLAANMVAGLLNRYRWIAYGGLLIILYVALRMIWDGAHEVMAYAGPS